MEKKRCVRDDLQGFDLSLRKDVGANWWIMDDCGWSRPKGENRKFCLGRDEFRTSPGNWIRQLALRVRSLGDVGWSRWCLKPRLNIVEGSGVGREEVRTHIREVEKKRGMQRERGRGSSG